MRIVQPYAQLLDVTDGLAALRTIEARARVSHRSEDQQTTDSWRRVLQAVVVEKGDWSVVEHVSASVELVVDRGVTHELVRHRLCSFTQESTRFVNYGKKLGLSFIYPQPEVPPCPGCASGSEPDYEENYGWCHSQADDTVMACSYAGDWLAAMAEAELSYGQLLRAGWRPQEARSVLPHALASKVIVTCNLRNWRHLFIMRTTRETHPQFRQVTVPLLAQFQATFPLLYDDLTPGTSQAENLRRPR